MNILWEWFSSQEFFEFFCQFFQNSKLIWNDNQSPDTRDFHKRNESTFSMTLFLYTKIENQFLWVNFSFIEKRFREMWTMTWNIKKRKMKFKVIELFFQQENNLSFHYKWERRVNPIHLIPLTNITRGYTHLLYVVNVLGDIMGVLLKYLECQGCLKDVFVTSINNNNNNERSRIEKYILSFICNKSQLKV